MTELWSQAAAHYYGVYNLNCYSGGTESTEFNPRAVQAMVHAGFEIKKTTEGTNPLYEVTFSNETKPITIFSKKYNDRFNPTKDFIAVMTCSHADANCPLVIGASKRISLTYADPKEFDGTPQETEQYRERALQIGKEMLFVFSRV
jgi:arsenate reductase